MTSDDFVRRQGDGPPEVVLLPGWGTDWRIFGDLELPGSALVARVPRPGGLGELLDGCSRDSVTLAGWSLGGFYAAKRAAEQPGPVKKLVLAGVRRSYPDGAVEDMLDELEEASETCLRDFYRRCFLPAQREDYRWFRSELMDDYLRTLQVERLRNGLRRLRDVELQPSRLPPVPTTLVHGTRDAVAPLDEARAIAHEADAAELRPVAGAGHAVFTHEIFRKVLDDG